MGDQDQPQKPNKGSQADANDKAALEAEPNWDRMGQIAKRLMATKPDPKATEGLAAPKRPIVRKSGGHGG